MKITKYFVIKRYFSSYCYDEFNRIINNGSEITDYEFKFIREDDGLTLEFQITPFTMPPSNIHAIMGVME